MLSTLKKFERTLAHAVIAGAFIAGGAGATLAQVQPGKPAPEFTLQDSSGKTVKLADFKGKTVVLEWTNQDCPYVRKHYGGGNMQQLQKDAAAKDVVWLTISSSAPGQQGHVNGLEAEELTKSRKAAPAAFLFDPDGKVGHAYDARTTPHMYVIDKAGVIAYMGAIDDKPTSNLADLKTARPYLKEAVEAVLAGEPVKVASTRAYGCSIKYATPRS
jgi:peroxiredoxin